MASFTERAKKAYARGEHVRALMVVINGLKRGHDTDEAIELLLSWYGVEHPREGLEADVAAALVPQPDADDLLSVLIDNLKHGGFAEIAQNLLAEGKLAGLTYVPAQPDAIKEPQEEPPPAIAQLQDETLDGIPVPNLSTLEEDVQELDAATDSSRVEVEPASTEEDATSEAHSEPDDEGGIENPQPSSEAPKNHTAAPAKSSMSAKRKLGSVLVAVVVVVVAFYGWQQARYASEIVSLDAQFQTMDPLDTAELRASVLADVKRWDNEPELEERLRFLDVVSWANPQGELQPITPWGLAANCLESAQKGQFEQALQSRARLERTEPEGLAYAWCDASVAEFRNAESQALESWKFALEKHPAFVAGYLGVIRAGVRRNDPTAVEWSLKKLKALRPEHPYLIAERVQPASQIPYFGLREAVEPNIPEPIESADKALSAMVYLVRAQEALAGHQWKIAQREVETAVAIDPSLAPALLLATVFRAGDYKMDDAARAAETLGRIKGLTRDFQALARSVVGRAFAFAGRPDVAAGLLGISKSGGSGWMARQFEGSLENAITDAVVLNELGRVDEAIEAVGSYARERQNAQAAYVAHVVSLQNGAKIKLDVELPVEASGARETAAAHFEGNHRRAADLGAKLGANSPYWAITVRFVVQSLLALRQVGKALAYLEAEDLPLVDRIFLDGVRVRAFSRLSTGSPDFKQLFAKMKAAEPVGVNRSTDLAYAAFWQGNRSRTSEFLDGALGRNDGHRKANWLKGVLLRSEGKFKTAAPFLAKAGRDVDSNAHVLLELGHVNFELGNYGEARKMFHRSLLQDRQDLVALRGLGRAYAQIGGDVAFRDLERILDHYPRTVEYAPQRAEVMRWLAVVGNVRKGNTEALRWLTSAETLVGRRGDLLVERARCDEANGDHVAARKLYAQALQNNSTLSDAHLGLGRTALAVGDTKVAKDHLKKFLEFTVRGPDRRWAEEKLADL